MNTDSAGTQKENTAAASLTTSTTPGLGASIADTFATGTAAGFATELLLHPLENPRPRGAAAAGATAAAAVSNSSGGMLRTALLRAPSTGLLMASYELARTALVPRLNLAADSFSTPLIAGAAAVFIETIVLSPAIVLTKQAEPTAVARTAWFARSVDTIKLLYRPAPTIIATTVPFVSLYYAFSDKFIAVLKSKTSSDTPSWLVSAAGGALGGAVAIGFSAPIEAFRLAAMERFSQSAAPTELPPTPMAKAVTSKLLHQSPRFAFRRAFFGILRQSVLKGGLRGLARTGASRGIAGAARITLQTIIRAVFRR
ncbi:hypothetical protein HDU82_000022 [Entophlyctis luteolus]|nr:hypothetical protein HDU82_000022 [Entophlyctis luteolus]